jgi:hypothetical protein
VITDYLKIITYLRVYSISVGKMYDNNGIEAGRGKMEVCWC